MRGGLCKERPGGAAPAGARERTRCSRRQSPPSSPSRAGGTQLGGGGGGEGETDRESRGLGRRERERIHCGTHPFSHTCCRCKSLVVPRAALVSGGAQRGERGSAPEEEPGAPHLEARASGHTTSLHTPAAHLQATTILFKALGSALLLPSLLFHSFSILLLSHHRVLFASRM